MTDDGYREPNTQEWRERVAERQRREALHFRVFCICIAAVLLGLFVWGIANQSSEPIANDDLPGLCQDNFGVGPC